MVVSGQEHHSVQKRQTTVSFEGTYEDFRELAIRITLAFTVAGILVVVVAPLFGYKIDLIVSQLNNLSSSDEAPLAETDPSVGADPTYGGYEASAGTGYGTGYGGYASPPATGYAAGAARKLASGWSSILSSIDLVDTAFNYMDIEDETCRLKTICEVESYAINHPLAKLAINTINKSLSGLERYQDAIDAGMNGQDCALIYDQCPFSYFGY